MKAILIPFLFLSLILTAQNVSISNRSYFLGRDYFVLRSGNAKMIVQCDKADIGPAFTYMLFDAETPLQSSRKKKAFNYNLINGFSSSALQVVMKNVGFHALGHNLVTHWSVENGIPSVEADWWASGIKVREVITPVSSNGVFKRTITLESADLVANDTVSLQLSLPAPALASNNKNILVCQNTKSSMAIAVVGSYPLSVSPSKESLKIGPLPIPIGEKIVIESYLFLQTSIDKPEDLYNKASTIDQWIPSESKTTAIKWKNSNTLTTPDSVIQNMYNNCRYILPGYVSDFGKIDAGIFEYGSQWVRDASNTALGIIHIGEFELARAILENMLENMIKDNGTTMISGGFDNPDREQFDQMGEFMHALKCYVDWTGDYSLLTEYTGKIVNMVERPLRPEFRDSTGMVHNRREFWERTFDDAYELAYQSWIIEGLRDAADLSEYINSEAKASYWRMEADKTLQAMLTHPTMKLVNNNHLIKRRNTAGDIVDKVKFYGWVEGAPSGVEQMSRLMPDASMTLPITLNLIDPKSSLSRNTLTELEKLWNQRWSFGGYDRYNTSSQGDQPGPWTFATTFMLRAQHEAGQCEMSRRSLEWLYNNAGGRTGAWFEEIPIISAQAATAGLLPWTSAEVSYFMIYHMMGIKFRGTQMVIKPALYANTAPLKANLRFRTGRFTIEMKGSGTVLYAIVNEKKLRPNKNGEIEVPDDFTSGSIQLFCK
jgi:hypothetical protein